MRGVVAFVLFLLLGLAASANAQTSDGVIVGRVLDPTGVALPGVSVELTTEDATLTTTVTDSRGSYRFDHVALGVAELSYRAIDFVVLRRTVTVAARELSVDVTLQLSLKADVVVTATSTFRNIADIENPAENLVGIAATASQGAITAAQLENRPVMRAGEVLETVPGMIVSQHSGEGKANQYYVRGFNLDHGTDFATTVAGVPVNTPTGAHAHGYSDLNFIIPELVSGVQFKKGPYFADEGDFSAAGAANINYVNRLEHPLVQFSGGQDGWTRALAAASHSFDSGALLGAVELNHNDGPWERPDDYRKINGVLRYSRGDNRNGLSLTAMTYNATWDSTDQVPQRAVDSALIPRFGLIDGTDGGSIDRETLAAEYQKSSGPSSLRATGFVLYDNLNLFSNFTYFLDDPDNGDQFEQAERRTAVGGRVSYRRLGHFLNRHTESAIGLQVRNDWLSPVGLYHTAERKRLATTREDRVNQTMSGVFAQSEIEWTHSIRTTLGLRADTYRFDVTSDLAANSGSGTDTLLSPKFSAAFGPWNGTEFYVSAGSGFHSNDARGAVISVDPTSGASVERVTPLVRAKGAEVGIRTVRIPHLQSTASLWYLGLDSELVFVGDAGTTEAGRPSRRVGVEWTNYWRPIRWMTIDGDVSFSHARFTEFDIEGDEIPGALDRVVAAGVSIEPRKPVFGSIRLRHFGPRPLNEDGCVKSQSTTLWNAEAGYRLSTQSRLVFELFNLFDAKVSDIDYFYTSRLAGEPAEGIEDIHTHPALPRSFRVAVQISF